ncbi:uncharacterized protein Dsimw501_GD26875 [Drosophila simulans]|uniref:Uncharacterized protein n=1 Tax=Drosophila simulans TaxID=7240 RepID=A0A0J9RA08_DROSI|nr:uncharacterized protein Dsimw501_GD26875 [Drosophila simulans]
MLTMATQNGKNQIANEGAHVIPRIRIRSVGDGPDHGGGGLRVALRWIGGVSCFDHGIGTGMDFVRIMRAASGRVRVLGG